MHILDDSYQFNNLFRNLSWNFLGQLISKISLLLFHIIFANMVGAASYGEFSFAYIGGMILIQPTLDLGLNQLITKWVSRGNLEVIRLSINIKGVISFALIPSALLIGWWMEINLFLQLTILFFFLINTIQQSLFGILRGLEDLRPESITVSLQNVLACIILGFFVFYEISTEPWIASLILLFSRTIGTIFFSAILWKNFINNLKNIENNSYILKSKKLLKEALTLGVVLFLIQFYFRIDTIMLGIIASEIEVGLYSTAYNLMEGTFFIPTVVMAAIFPRLSQTKYFLTFFRKGALLLSLSGLACGGAFFFLAEFIINWFFKPEFQNSIHILKTLSLAIPLVYLGYLSTQSLVALDYNRIYLAIIFSGLILNVILNFWMIPKYGAFGAALATVITEAFIPLNCFLIILKYHFNRSSLNES